MQSTTMIQRLKSSTEILFRMRRSSLAERRQRISVAKIGEWKNAFTIFIIWVATAIASSAQTFSTLVSFNVSNGSNPNDSLVQGLDGKFYGTTVLGGSSTKCPSGCGTIFTITPSGTLTMLHSFDYTDGAAVYARLVQGTDGNFYGTTSGGGVNTAGTVFKITPSGTLTTLHSFASTDGSLPVAGLVQASNGNFYGTTQSGGAHGYGTVFKITGSGTLTTLYNFCAQVSCTDGATPHGALVQATNGNFYGMTQAGGAFGLGTIFKITPSGTLTTLYRFCASGICTDGADPYGGLVQATNGNLYGTTYIDGANGHGTVFRITPSGTLTTIYSFCSQSNCTDGSEPTDGLVQATDGNFYGTTIGAGAYNQGTIFKITPGGTLTTLYSFCAQTGCTDGQSAQAGLVQGTDGNLYGTTYRAGQSTPVQSSACLSGFAHPCKPFRHLARWEPLSRSWEPI
jgi:uncharacterized repeat protein (TIGR03803 family)